MEKNYLEGVDIIYWINMEKDTVRHRKMTKMFVESDVFRRRGENIPIIKISAVDGERDNIFNYMVNMPLQIKETEYACAISHYIAIQSFSMTKYKTALIIEDDMTLDFRPFWKNTIGEIAENAPNDWDIIQLCYISDRIPADTYEEIKYNNTNHLYSTGAYLIRNEAAKNTVKRIYDPSIKKYRFTYENLNHQIDHYLYSLNKTYCYKYPMFIYSYNNNSSINNDHSTFHYESRLQIENTLHYLLKCEEYKIHQLYNTMGIITAALGILWRIGLRYVRKN